MSAEARRRAVHAWWPALRRVATGLLVTVAASTLTACHVFGGDSGTPAVSVSVFTIEPGQCFMAPSTVTAQLADLSRVPCSSPHTQEAYAKVDYRPAGTPPGVTPSASASSDGGAYPGNDVLTAFADGACAAQFAGYVGVSYLDSSLYFTYLLPSARSWEQSDDRTVLCFVTQAGGTRTGSAKGSRL